MPCEESIADAKATFITAVAEGITTLVQQCGYSRDRATSVLLREMNRGESTRPSDTEVYDTMERYNLGIEEATKTIVVSKALRRAMASGSPAEAIELLASKISLRNLLYDSPDEEPTSDIRPQLRVEPLSRMDLQPTSRRAKSTPVRKPKTPLKAARARTKTPSKNVMAGRKRSIEEIASVEKKDSTRLQKHDRSDSLGAEVDAKIAKQSNDEAPANEPAMRPTPNVRAKRVHRAEEAETISQTANTHNRTRGSEG